MASFAPSATACGARKHAWTKMMWCQETKKAQFQQSGFEPILRGKKILIFRQLHASFRTLHECVYGYCFPRGIDIRSRVFTFLEQNFQTKEFGRMVRIVNIAQGYQFRFQRRPDLT